MEGYKTSRDYKRFRELLDKGKKVIVLCGYDGCGIAHKDYTNWYCVNGFYKDADASDEAFRKWCANHNIEFLEPEL